jgi:transcriptional regulator with XRE-family HTH domain
MDAFAQAVGEVLRNARRSRGLTLNVSRLTAGSFKVSVLGGDERGERTVSLERFSQLATLYGVPADRLLGDVLARTDPQGRVEIVIDLNRLALLDESEVRRVARVHPQRQDQAGRLPHRRRLAAVGRCGSARLSSGVAPQQLLSRLRPALRGNPGRPAGGADLRAGSS